MTLLDPKQPLPTFYWRVRAYYEDTDASGVVYHAQYLKFFERARTEWLRSLGFSQQGFRDRLAVVFTVANLDVDFLRPARLDDDLEVAVIVHDVRRASLHFRQALSRSGEREAVLARANVRVACVDVANFRPCPMPDEFITHIQKLVAGGRA